MEVRSVQTIVQALNSAEVRYIIVGGLAVNAHGCERFTNDIDIVIAFDTPNIVNGLNALMDVGYRPIVPVTVTDFANPEIRKMWQIEKEMRVLQLWSEHHRRTPIDIFVYAPFDFNEQYGRAQRMDVGEGIFGVFVARDALIAMKRSVGRPQDLADVSALEHVMALEEAEEND